MQYDTYASLLSCIQDAWHGHYSLSSLSSLLSSHSAALSSVSEPPPSPSSRASVESRSVRLHGLTIDLSDANDPSRTSRHTVDYVLSLSATLHLDELATVHLLSAASALTPPSSSSPSSPTPPLLSRTISLHFTRRYNLLVALLDLVLMWQNPAFPSDLLLVVDAMLGRLVGGGLVGRLVEVVRELVGRLGQGEGTVREQQRLELHHLLRVLLAITRKHSLSTAEVTALLSTLQALSTQLPPASVTPLPHSAVALPHPPHAWLSFTCYSLLTSFISALDTRLSHLILRPSPALTSPSNAADAEVKGFISAVSAQGEREGDGGWGGAVTFHAAYLLAFSLFLRRIKPLYPDLSLDDLQVTNMMLLAISSDVSLLAAVHTDFLTSPTLATESRREEVSEVWTELYAALIVEGGEELELLKEEEPQQGDEVGGYFYFLSSLAQLCRVSEGNVALLWQVPEVVELLKQDLTQSTAGSPSASLLPSPLLPAYISLLSALTLDTSSSSTSSDYAWRVYSLLRSTSLLSWSQIFGIFHTVANVYLPQPHAASAVGSPANPPPIPPREASLLCSFLSLLASVLSSPDVAASLTKPDFRTLDRLFALLGCRVDTTMKARTVDALTALVKSQPAMATQVWSRMDAAGVLPREGGGAGAGAGGGGGLYYDLEEVESVQRRYPLTIAFARLILTLLFVAPLPSPTLSHYPHFVTHSLFLSLSDRQYLSPHERWKLTEASLALSSLLLNPPYPQPPELTPLAAEVAQQLLAGKEVLVKLLEVISRTYQLLEMEGEAGGETAGIITEGLGGWDGSGGALERGEEGLRAVEGSLAAALRVVWQVVEREDDWVDRLRSARVYPLSSLLFSHPQEILVIAHATAHLSLYPPSFASRVLVKRDRESRRGGQTWGEEGANEDDAEDEEDERGVIAYHAALILHSLSTTSDARLAHLLLASRLAADISRAFASQLRLTQLPSSAGEGEGEKEVAHLARLELVKALVESVGRGGGGGGEGAGEGGEGGGGLGVVLLGFEVGGSGEDVRRQRLELSERKATLDAIVELVNKPRSALITHSHPYTCTPTRTAQTLHLGLPV